LPGAGPAGLRGLLKSPPHLAGQALATWRATRFNPCRKPPWFILMHSLAIHFR